MDRSPSLLRWLLIGVAVFLFVTNGIPAITSGTPEVQPLGRADDTAAATETRSPEERCTVRGPRFRAEFTSRGGSLASFVPDESKYNAGGDTGLVTTTLESRRPLRTDLRLPEAAKDKTPQVAYDDLDWKLTSKTDTSCTFSYEDEATSATKIVATTERPFEIALELKVRNQAADPRAHRLTVENAEWFLAKDTKGSWGSQSEYQTQVEFHSAGKMVRQGVDDFDPKDFAEGFTDEKWRRSESDAALAAVSTSYFTKALIPTDGAKPFGETLIEEVYSGARDPKNDRFGHTYRARLNYGPRELAAGETASYRVLAFVGPKERALLTEVGGGRYPTADILNLGAFGSIGKLLIRYVYLLFGFVGSWGWAIVLLTITVKLVLFPLSITQIKSTMAMRKLKPEMDAINAKYKDDAQQRGLALQELWRKNKVANPLMGCLPLLLQMPIWWALYTSLQTAVELYHTPFGPFVPDLSAPGKYFIIPALLGASSFLQQHLMPAQGDPTQQQMMKWMMPTIFTVMMLFLPAGLGIYFLTNTWLGILQQVLVERYYQARDNAAAPTAA